jgi:hypothetical protein
MIPTMVVLENVNYVLCACIEIKIENDVLVYFFNTLCADFFKAFCGRQNLTKISKYWQIFQQKVA